MQNLSAIKSNLFAVDDLSTWLQSVSEGLSTCSAVTGVCCLWLNCEAGRALPWDFFGMHETIQQIERIEICCE